MNHLFVFLTLLFAAFSVQAVPIDSIKVGNGGGITGSVSTYKVSKAGIIQSTRPQSAMPIRIGKNAFKKLCKKANLALQTIETFNKPGNTYKFLQIYSNGQATKYTWGNPTFETPAIITKLYADILSLIPKPN